MIQKVPTICLFCKHKEVRLIQEGHLINLYPCNQCGKQGLVGATRWEPTIKEEK